MNPAVAPTPTPGTASTPASNWSSLAEFARWYHDQDYPLRVPAGTSIQLTDVSASWVVFREGAYQAELYLLKPGARVPPHTHQAFETLTVHLGGACHARRAASHTSDTVLAPGAWHALDVHEQGAILLVLQRWLHGTPATDSSATLAYEGPALGPLHARRLAAQQVPDC